MYFKPLLPVLSLLFICCSCNRVTTPCAAMPPIPPLGLLYFKVVDKNGKDLFAIGTYDKAKVSAVQPCHLALTTSFNDSNVLSFPNLRQPTAAEPASCTDIYVNWDGTDTDTLHWEFTTGGGEDNCPIFYMLKSVSFNGTTLSENYGDYYLLTK